MYPLHNLIAACMHALFRWPVSFAREIVFQLRSAVILSDKLETLS